MYPHLQLTSDLQIPTYYLVISITVCICLLWLNQRATEFKLSRKVTLDISLIVMVASFVGARLFHVFYEDFAYYQEDWLRVFEFWNGGFVFYGGAIFAAICGFTFLHFQREVQNTTYMDLFAPVFSLSYLLGRIGCLLAGCCYGRYCDLPWAISQRHPTQAYASLWELGVLIILLAVEKTPRTARWTILKPEGAVFYLWMCLHAAGRLLMEAFRDDFRGPTWGLSISSWISLSILVAGVFLLLWKPTSRSRTSST